MAAPVVCYRCGKEVTGVYLTIATDGHRWHPDCFCCTTCSKNLSEVSNHYRFDSGSGYLPYCDQHYCELVGLICAGCKGPITTSQVVTAINGQKWHPHHFNCAQCDTSLLGISYFVGHDDSKPYCERDYNTKYRKKCALCNHIMYDQVMITPRGEVHAACWEKYKMMMASNVPNSLPMNKPMTPAEELAMNMRRLEMMASIDVAGKNGADITVPQSAPVRNRNQAIMPPTTAAMPSDLSESKIESSSDSAVSSKTLEDLGKELDLLMGIAAVPSAKNSSNASQLTPPQFVFEAAATSTPALMPLMPPAPSSSNPTSSSSSSSISDSSHGNSVAVPSSGSTRPISIIHPDISPISTLSRPTNRSVVTSSSTHHSDGNELRPVVLAKKESIVDKLHGLITQLDSGSSESAFGSDDWSPRRSRHVTHGSISSNSSATAELQTLVSPSISNSLGFLGSHPSQPSSGATSPLLPTVKVSLSLPVVQQPDATSMLSRGQLVLALQDARLKQTNLEKDLSDVKNKNSTMATELADLRNANTMMAADLADIRGKHERLLHDYQEAQTRAERAERADNDCRTAQALKMQSDEKLSTLKQRAQSAIVSLKDKLAEMENDMRRFQAESARRISELETERNTSRYELEFRVAELERERSNLLLSAAANAAQAAAASLNDLPLPPPPPPPPTEFNLSNHNERTDREEEQNKELQASKLRIAELESELEKLRTSSSRRIEELESAHRTLLENSDSQAQDIESDRRNIAQIAIAAAETASKATAAAEMAQRAAEEASNAAAEEVAAAIARAEEAIAEKQKLEIERRRLRQLNFAYTSEVDRLLHEAEEKRNVLFKMAEELEVVKAQNILLHHRASVAAASSSSSFSSDQSNSTSQNQGQTVHNASDDMALENVRKAAEASIAEQAEARRQLEMTLARVRMDLEAEKNLAYRQRMTIASLKDSLTQANMNFIDGSETQSDDDSSDDSGNDDAEDGDEHSNNNHNSHSSDDDEDDNAKR